MKQIVAYIKPNKLPAVTLALHKLPDLPGMSFCEVRGFGRDRTQKIAPPIIQDLIDYSPYMRIEVFCPDDQVFEVKYTIERAAHTGRNGDGKIYIIEVSQALRIQTEEVGDVAA